MIIILLCVNHLLVGSVKKKTRPFNVLHNLTFYTILYRSFSIKQVVRLSREKLTFQLWDRGRQRDNWNLMEKDYILRRLIVLF